MRCTTIISALFKATRTLRSASQVTTRALHATSLLQHEMSPSPPLQLTQSYVHAPGSMPYIGATIGESLLSTVEKTPDQESLVFCDAGIRLTFAEFMKKVDQFAASLHNLGLRKGDRIGIWGPSTVEWVITQFATARLGLLLVNINPAYQMREVEYALRKTGTKAIVSAVTYKTQKYYQMLSEISPELLTRSPGKLKSKKMPDLTTVIMMGTESLPGTFNFEDVMEIGTSTDVAQVHNISRSLDFDEPINIQFTSGTTGFPKGATLSHHNIMNNIRCIGMRIGFDDYYHRICCQVPLYHCFGMVGGTMACSVFGMGVIFPCAGYDPVATLRSLQEEKCSVIYGTPTMFIDGCNHPDVSKYDYSSVEKGIMAGSPCPPEVVLAAEKTFSCRILPTYGTTENSPVTFMNFLNDPDEVRFNSVGMPSGFNEAKIVDADGRIVPVNTRGELWIRGYNVMLGYWDAQDETKDVITKEGWYKTGDIGTIDEHGYGRITGRTKDMLIRGGENIYPTEIEDIIYGMAEVDNVQVFGIPDERMGEEVAAWIRLRDGKSVTADEIRQFCKGKMAHFKIPKYIKFVDEFPLTITRKVQKFKMQELYAEELKQKKQ